MTQSHLDCLHVPVTVCLLEQKGWMYFIANVAKISNFYLESKIENKSEESLQAV